MDRRLDVGRIAYEQVEYPLALIVTRTDQFRMHRDMTRHQCGGHDALAQRGLETRSLGRSLAHPVESVQALAARSVGFRSLQEQLDTTTSGGKLVFHLFAALAEFERDLIRERTNAGLVATRARGRPGGRPKGIDEKKRKAAFALKRDLQYTIMEICEIVEISRNTYYKSTRTDEQPH